LRPGHQIGLRIRNTENRIGYLENIRLHFDELVRNATFRIRVKKITEQGMPGEDILHNELIVQPHSLSLNLNIDSLNILFPLEGIFIGIDYVGDGNTYSSIMDAPPIKVRVTSKSSENNTFFNFMDKVDWIHYKNSRNIQTQITVKFKKLKVVEITPIN